MNRVQSILLFAAIATAVLIVSNATAGYLTGDPRVCAKDSRPTVCVYYAAVATTKQAVARKEGLPKWDGWVWCRRIGPLLHQVCIYKQDEVAGKADVTFKATSKGWKRIVKFS